MQALVTEAWTGADLKIVKLLRDLLAGFAHEELLGFQHRGLKLLKAKTPADLLKVPKQPAPHPVLLWSKVSGPCEETDTSSSGVLFACFALQSIAALPPTFTEESGTSAC